jgi:hypothetical protein
MFGIACKGLHCAGCGKGIPLGIVIILIGLATRINDAALAGLADALMWSALIIGGCVMVTGTIVALVQRRDFQMIYGKWDGPTMAQAKAEETWADRARLGADPFRVREEISPVADTVEWPA